MSKLSRLEVIETGARRRWTLEEKLRIVAESASGPRLVSSVARRHGLSANQLFVWRRQVREGKLGGEGSGSGFIRAIVAPPGEGRELRLAGDRRPGHGRIEIVLSEPRRLIVEGDVDMAAVAGVMAMLAS